MIVYTWSMSKTKNKLLVFYDCILLSMYPKKVLIPLGTFWKDVYSLLHLINLCKKLLKKCFSVRSAKALIMIMMRCFCGIVDRWKVFSFLLSQVRDSHCTVPLTVSYNTVPLMVRDHRQSPACHNAQCFSFCSFLGIVITTKPHHHFFLANFWKTFFNGTFKNYEKISEALILMLVSL